MFNEDNTTEQMILATFEKNGWINLGTHRVLQPQAFAKVKDLIGVDVLNEIIGFNNNLDLQGNVIIGSETGEIDKKRPFKGIGMTEFYKRLEKLRRNQMKQNS